jgi:hypothetical protein
MPALATNTSDARREMIDVQIAGRGIRDKRVLEALRVVPRAVGWNGTPHYRRAGVDFLVQEIPRKRSREFLSSIPKQALEASRRQLGVTHWPAAMEVVAKGSPVFFIRHIPC